MQVNEKVNASNFFPKGIQAGKNSDKTVQADFASLLAPSSNTSGLDASGVQRSLGSQKPSEKAEVNKHDFSNKDLNDSKIKKENDISAKKDVESEKVVEHADFEDDESKVNPLKENETLELLGSVLQQLMNWFGLSQTDLDGKLKESGLEMSDLLMEDGQKSFFLFMNSAEMSDLLVNENLNQEWKQFLEFLPDLQQSNLVLSDIEDCLQQSGSMTVVDMMMQSAASGIKEFNEKPLYESEENEKIVTDSNEPDVIVLNQRKVQTSEKKQDGMFNQNQQTGDSMSDEIGSAAEKKSDHKSFNHFDNPVLQTVEQFVDTVGKISAVEDTAVSGKDIINQIVEQVRIQLNQDNTSLEMQLYPEHLGKIQIHVVSKDGVLTARIMAETEAAKQAVEGGLASLKESMENQNLKVEAIEVMVSTAGFEQENQKQNSFEQQKNPRSGKKIHLDDAEENENVDETIEIEKMKHSGSSVSYIA